MANLTEVQLPNGTTYNLVDDESGYQTEAQVNAKIADKADKTLVSYCSCSTAAATAQKEVVAPEGWELETGRIIAVKFVNTNTANNPTLKVGTADAKGIYYNNAVVTTGSLFAGGEADKVTLYIYDGTRFVWLGHSADDNTTYDAMTASELTTGTATSLRTVRADYLKTGINTLVSGKANKTDIATVESGTTASRAYSVGELVYVSGTLYRVKTAIASGATFTEGTNVEATNVSNTLTEQLIDVSEHFSSSAGVKITAFKSKKSNSIVLNLSGNGSYPNGGVVISYDSTINANSGLNGNYLGMGNAYQVSANKFFNLMGLFNTTSRTILLVHSENIAANIVEFSINIPLS